jgi:hypothetical protein
MAELVERRIAAPSTETKKIQEGHIVLGQYFCVLIEKRNYGDRKPG